MPSEREKMLAGEPYRSADGELIRLRARARQLCRDYNAIPESDLYERKRLLTHLLGAGGESACIQAPFHCDYGFNLKLGAGVCINFNCVVLDVCEVKVGEHTLLGPAVQIYSATHPMSAPMRRREELGKPVTIGADVWIGGGAIVCPGVSVGDRSVIGAGSVVVRSIPAGVFAAGNPCRVIRPLTD